MARVKAVPNKFTSSRKLSCLAVWCPPSDLNHFEDRITMGEGSDPSFAQLLGDIGRFLYFHFLASKMEQ